MTKCSSNGHSVSVLKASLGAAQTGRHRQNLCCRRRDGATCTISAGQTCASAHVTSSGTWPAGAKPSSCGISFSQRPWAFRSWPSRSAWMASCQVRIFSIIVLSHCWVPSPLTSGLQYDFNPAPTVHVFHINMQHLEGSAAASMHVTQYPDLQRGCCLQGRRL